MRREAKWRTLSRWLARSRNAAAFAGSLRMERRGVSRGFEGEVHPTKENARSFVVTASDGFFDIGEESRHLPKRSQNVAGLLQKVVFEIHDAAARRGGKESGVRIECKFIRGSFSTRTRATVPRWDGSFASSRCSELREM
jgi:hypothetical protein